MNDQLPLHKDQIYSDAWVELCDYAFDEIVEPWIFDKAATSDLQLFDSEGGIDKSGVIYIGTNQNIFNCLQAIPEHGNYILISRDNDRSITEDIYRRKPKSVKHWFAINCAVNYPDITAIPYGVSGIGGYSKTLEFAGEIERTEDIDGRILYARLNCPPEMTWPHERHKCLAALEHNPIAKVIWQPIDGMKNFEYMKTMPFVASPNGTAPDCLRHCESITLGCFPILSDCLENRNAYSKLPVIFTKDWNLNKEQLMNEVIALINRQVVTDKARMSYWVDQINLKKQEYGIGL